MCPMWDNDIVYGGEQLEPNVTLKEDYILWECGIVAENVKTSLGDDGTKCEVVISKITTSEADGSQFSEPAKFGTFATSIVSKVRLKADGDLPAVIQFEKIPAKDASKQDAFVMGFVRPWRGGTPVNPLPEIAAVNPGLHGFGAPVKPEPPKADLETGQYYTVVGGRKVYGDTIPPRILKTMRADAIAAGKLKDNGDGTYSEDIPF